MAKAAPWSWLMRCRMVLSDDAGMGLVLGGAGNHINHRNETQGRFSRATWPRPYAASCPARWCSIPTGVVSTLPAVSTNSPTVWACSSPWAAPGVCFDDAMAESFWPTLKHEFYQLRVWTTRAEAHAPVTHEHQLLESTTTEAAP